MLLRLVIVAALLALYPAAARASEARAPTAQWVVNFADAQCLAGRDYGSSEDPLRLVLKAPLIGEVMQIAIMRKASSAKPDQVDGRISIDGRPPLKTYMLRFTPDGSDHRVYMLNMRSADFALVQQAKELSVRSEGLNESFALSQMTPLLKILDQCVLDLRQVWNVSDPQGAQSVALQRRAKGNLARLVDDQDYPRVALDNNQGGKVKFVLLIGEDGRVADCTIIETSGVAALDAQSCALLKTRAKFEPALGVDGKPAKDTVISTITWRTAF